jgi:arylsulfatase A-like enzyme
VADSVVGEDGSREPRPARLRDWVDRYDSSIAYLDHELGLLFDELESRGLLDNTLVVITSDHGEQFGEHGLTHHGNSLYTSLLHVPLVLVPPASSGIAHARGRREEPVSLRDLPATILDVVDAEGGLPGRSLLAGWPMPGTDPTAAGVVLSSVSPENVEENGPLEPGQTISLIAGNFHYIRTPSGTEMLYDLSADPEESVNLAELPSSERQLRATRRRLNDILASAGAPVRAGAHRP